MNWAKNLVIHRWSYFNLLFYSPNPRSEIRQFEMASKEKIEYFSPHKKHLSIFPIIMLPSRQVGWSGRFPAAILGGVLCWTKLFNSELSLRAGCLLISPTEKDPTKIPIAPKNKNMANFKGVVE